MLKINSERPFGIEIECFIPDMINNWHCLTHNIARGHRPPERPCQIIRGNEVASHDIDEQLKIAKVANRDMVMQGLFNPSQINKNVLSLALQGTERKAAQPVPIGDLALTQVNLTGQSLQGQFVDPGVQSNRLSATRASDVLRQEELNKILTGKP